MSNMIADMESHFRGLVPKGDDLLGELEQEALRENIPIVGPVVGELLFILARITGARRILELGTATGYSAIHLALGCQPQGGKVITLELDEVNARRARENFKRAGLEANIEVRVGEALSLLPTLSEPFDLIFLDINKEAYLAALPECQRLLELDGVLVADNTGFQDAAAFNQAISQLNQWRAVNLLCFLPRHSPEHDGLCLAVRMQ
jgi:predicted O-methyltransferase YrrM